MWDFGLRYAWCTVCFLVVATQPTKPCKLMLVKCGQHGQRVSTCLKSQKLCVSGNYTVVEARRGTKVQESIDLYSVSIKVTDSGRAGRPINRCSVS